MKLTEIKEEKYHLKLDLRYATKNNFTKRNYYYYFAGIIPGSDINYYLKMQAYFPVLPSGHL